MFFSRYYLGLLRYPLAFPTLALGIGIGLGYQIGSAYYRVGFWGASVSFLCWLAAPLVVRQCRNKRLASLFKDVLGILFIGLGGYTYFHYRIPIHDAQHFSHIIDQIEEYQGVVIDEVKTKRRFYTTTLVLEKVRVGATWQPARGKIKLSGFGSAQGIAYGDRVQVQGKPEVVPPPLNPHTFNYGLSLEVQGIHHQHHLGKKQFLKLESNAKNGWQAHLYRIRTWSHKQLKRYCSDPDAEAILLAIVLGMRGGLDPILKEMYSSMGIMHILAVSGLHVGLVYLLLLLLFYLLSFLTGRRRVYYLLAIVGLWAYAFLTGLAPSVLRAVGMFTFISLGKWLRRSIIMGNVFAAIAFFLLLYNPYLLFSVGFQLSFSAVWGIFSFYPSLSSWWHSDDLFIHGWWKMTAVSLAAQLGTFPLTLYYFHTFPTYFLLGNWIMLPLASFLLTSGLGILLFSGFPFLAYRLASFVSYVLAKANWVLILLSELPCAAVNNLFPSFGYVALLYASLFSFSLDLSRGKRKYGFGGVLLLLGLAGWSTYTHIQKGYQEKIIFYSVAPYQALALVAGRKAILISVGKIYPHDFIYQREVAPSMRAMGIDDLQWCRLEKLERQDFLPYQDHQGVHIILWKSQKIAFLHQAADLPDRLKVDVLVVEGAAFATLKEVLCRWEVGQIIVVGKVDEEMCTGLKVHLLSKDGAYIREVSRS